MNLQQLKQNGQRIQVFIITAVTALLLTFFVWLCTAQYRNYVQNREQMNTYRFQTEGKNSYTVMMRIALLIKLLVKGHGHWVWNTHAWVSIMKNEIPRWGRGPDAKAKLLHGKMELQQQNLEQFHSLTAYDYLCMHLVQDRSREDILSLFCFDHYTFKEIPPRDEAGNLPPA